MTVFEPHAHMRARTRAGLSPVQLAALWHLSRVATDADARRFATIRVSGCKYRIAVYHWSLFLLIADGRDEQPITIDGLPQGKEI